MKTPVILTFAAGLLVSMSADAVARDGLSITHSEALRQLEIRTNGPLQRESLELLEPVRMQFEALGRRFDLTLEPNTALLSPAARGLIDGRIEVLRGRIDGNRDSWARIVLTDGVPSGIIYDGSELLAIEPPGDSAVESAAGPVVFRLADMMIEPGTMSCAAGGAPASGQALYQEMVGELRTALQTGPGAVEEIEIGAIADSDFTNGRTNPQQALLTRMNNVDGIYSSELGIQITVPAEALELFDDSNDPFSDSNPDGELQDLLIDELALYRFDSAAQSARGLTHLFTGKDLGGSTVGIAYIGVLCSSRFGVGLTEARSGVTTDSLIAAHEIGHNFGAEHDGDPNGSCPDVPNNQFIMASRVNGNDTFSECSKQVMLAEASGASCIVPLPSTDVSVTSFNQPESILLGNAINLNFAVENRGSLQAGNVGIEVSIPANVSLLAASSTVGNCTSGAGIVNCAIGALAGNTAVTVSLSADTLAAGNAAFTAVLSADGDESLGNNQDTHIVRVDPAVDLVANSPAPASVNLNSSGSASVTIENQSVLAATEVTATITLDAGLRADSASWSAGSCTVSANQIDCAAASLAASSTSTLTLGLSGLALGSQGYTITLGSSEADANTGNNVVSGTVTVRETGSSNADDDESGGGAPGVFLLAILAAAGLRRRLV
jgi:hypothetical protein